LIYLPPTAILGPSVRRDRRRRSEVVGDEMDTKNTESNGFGWFLTFVVVATIVCLAIMMIAS
jgi:hypothetical protein